jgi:hypothetical protein
VSPVRRAITPRGVLYRIGRLPDPLAWAPHEVAGGGRFDDPQSEFRVLYAGQRRACFLETLAPFRPSVEALAALQQVTGSQEPIPRGMVPADWYQKRAVARLRLRPGQRWLDLRATETSEALRSELAATLLDLGLADLDLSEVLGPWRSLTQAIARWAYEHDYAGIVYPSRFKDALSLWAIFEGAAFDPVGVPEPIVPDDPDLVATARLFGLAI